MKYKNIILYITFIAILFILGGWAYQEVAVKYRPLSPDEILEQKEKEEVKKTEETASLIQSQNKRFTSGDGLITFEIPTEWTSEVSSSSSVIANFAKNTKLSGGFPEDGVRIDVVTTKLTEELKNKSVIACEMKSISCDEKNINGQQFKSSEAILNTGFISKQLGTDLDENRIVLNIVIGTGDRQSENKELVNKLINTIQVKK